MDGVTAAAAGGTASTHSMVWRMGSQAEKLLHLRPCEHQVAGHLFEEGKAGSLVDAHGHFYKPLQVGPRGRREREFYETVAALLRSEAACTSCSHSPEQQQQPPACELQSTCTCSSSNGQPTTSAPSLSARAAGTDPTAAASMPHMLTFALCSCTDGEGPSGKAEMHLCLQQQQQLHHQASFQSQPFSTRNATLLRAIPQFYGVHELPDRTLVELEDLAARYTHPSIIDIKVGFHTWYHGADQRYIEKCKVKDSETTQAALGFKVCGMQVYRQGQGGYWRCSKRWCKTLPEGGVDAALLRFAHNGGGLRPVDVYGGERGAVAALQALEAWFARQREFMFYSSSVLIIYEGDAECAEEADVSVRLVDFAHSWRQPGFPHGGEMDSNFAAGLHALIKRLVRVMRYDVPDLVL